MMSDASEMLAAALEQMDGIIAGKPRAAAALSGRGPSRSRATSGSSYPWKWEFSVQTMLPSCSSSSSDLQWDAGAVLQDVSVPPLAPRP